MTFKSLFLCAVPLLTGFPTPTHNLTLPVPLIPLTFISTELYLLSIESLPPMTTY